MKNLKFKYLAAYNFMCFGPEGIEIDLEKYGNIVLVKGRNYDDVKKETGVPGSNGTGKSSLQEILVYGLYGKPIKSKMNHTTVINNKSKARLRVEVRWDNYRVVRTRRADSLRIWTCDDGDWDNAKELSLGKGAVETQKLIESIIGLDYRTFVNLVVFDYKNSYSFLECDLADKRQIVEKLLCLDKYAEFSDTAKELLKDAKKTMTGLSDEYLRLNDALTAAQKRVLQIESQNATWKSVRVEELTVLINQIKARTFDLNSSDIGAAVARWNEAQEEILTLIAQIPAEEAKIEQVGKLVDGIKLKLSELEKERSAADHQAEILTKDIYGLTSTINKLKSSIAQMEAVTSNVVCDRCLGEVDQSRFATLIQENKDLIVKHQAELEEMQPKKTAFLQDSTNLGSEINKHGQTAATASNKIAGFSRNIATWRARIVELNKIRKPEADSHALLLEQQIESLKTQAKAKKAELEQPSPFVALLASAQVEVHDKDALYKAKKAEIQDAESIIPYYSYWVQAFGDKGIRKHIIDGIIPSLNENIAYWLDHLIYGNISLTFDNELQETITRVPHTEDDDPFIFQQMSGGEQQRLNLAVPFSFAHIMGLSTGTIPSLLFLDEVAINIDENGIENIYNLIVELSNDKQVLVTDHNPILLDMLQHTDRLELERRNFFTKKVA
jgi:DNA repair exonuclease SbcCD ATPase subunit